MDTNVSLSIDDKKSVSYIFHTKVTNRAELYCWYIHSFGKSHSCRHTICYLMDRVQTAKVKSLCKFQPNCFTETD